MKLSVGLVLGTVVFIALTLASLTVGSNPIPLSSVWNALQGAASEPAHTIVIGQRLPRTVLVILVGAALGTAGALMQALTRNPLADPGILGINAGASLAVVSTVAVVGTISIWGYMWVAMMGAAAASVIVYLLGTISPARLALAGVAVSMAVNSLVQMVILNNQHAFNEFRLWAAGSTEGRGWPIIVAIVGPILVGLFLAFAATGALNALALGDETSAALGVNLARLRIHVMAAVMILAGAATAAVGPLLFIGLGVPYLARFLAGENQRWVIVLSAALSPLVLLAADLVARTIVAPSEIQTGIVAAIIGGPVFIGILRSGKTRL